MRYDVILIGAALICLIAGTSLGLWFMLPFGGDLALLPSHVHFNLLGWATLAIYGMIHRAFPELARARLAPIHMALALVGAILLPIGFGSPRESALHIPTVALGALAGLLAAIVFSIMYFGKVMAKQKAQPRS